MKNIKKRFYNTRKRRAKAMLNKAIIVITAILISNGVIAYAGESINAYESVEVTIPKKEAPAQENMKDWVRKEIEKAGLKWEDVDCLIKNESGWNPDKHRVNWKNMAGVDRGLWQISSLHHKEVSNQCTYDYKCATKEAIRIAKERGNYSAWHGYTNNCLK